MKQCTCYALRAVDCTCKPAKYGELYTSTQPKQEQGEPVAWAEFDGEGGYHFRAYENNEDYAEQWDKRNPNHVGWVKPLYTTPQQRKPLTDEQIYDMYNEPRSDAEMLAFARAIEAAHGIKE